MNEEEGALITQEQFITLISEALAVIQQTQDLKNIAAPFNKRNQDLNTLSYFQSLLEAVEPVSNKVGDDIFYEPVFQGKDREAMKKTVLKICRQIHKEYGEKKDEPENESGA